jgi:single-strand DNA-binding protein
MSDTITLTGVVASLPRSLTTSEGLAISSFRLASAQRRFDKGQQKWVEGETNWYTVSAFRQLAANLAISLSKGDRVLVSGRLRIREWQAGGKSGTNIEVEADSIGHDLSWGTAAFSRSVGSTPVDASAQQHAEDSPSPDSVTMAEFPSENQLAGGGESLSEQPVPNEREAELVTPF